MALETRSHPSAMPDEPMRKKRMRITFSCSNCRHSKQKCNRETPCMTCILRGKQDTCSYGEAGYGQPPSSLSLHMSDIDDVPQQSETVVLEYSPPDEEPPSPDLASFGYSSANSHNSLGILQKLDKLELGGAPRPPRRKREVSLCQASQEIHKSILKQLACSSCVKHLVKIFIAEVNWQYTILDINYFVPKLEQHYSIGPLNQFNAPSNTTFSSEQVIFSALLFQVLAYALQSLPPSYLGRLHPSCLTSLVDEDKEEGVTEDASIRLLSLIPKNVINLDYITTQLLRTAWLKNRGLVAESWSVLAQATINAQEIGLHHDDGKLYADNAESAIEELWEVVLRRRLMLNLFLWDGQMGMVLGKPLNFKSSEYALTPPTDCEIPRNRTSTAPFQRANYDKPNVFTLRLLEYRLHRYIPQIRALEAEGPYPRDYGKVERLHQIALEYIARLPAAYRFENPDTTCDEECPWLAIHRESLCATLWLFVLMLHRTYIFSISQSRREILKAGNKVLNAQQRFFLRLKPHHYRMFALTYLTVEPCISILAVLIAFPNENADLIPEAFRCIKESLSRLRIVRTANKVAGQGADIIQNLLVRAQKYHTVPMFDVATGNSSSEGIPGRLTSPRSQGSDQFYTMSDQPTLFAANTTFDNTTDWGLELQQQLTAAVPVSSDYAFDATPFRPVADLTYNDIALTMSQESFNLLNGSDHVADTQPQQFRGAFGEGSFWNFINAGS